MSTPEMISVFLPHWQTGERSIRFLYLAGSSSFKICDRGNAEDTMVPLFLGADLFSKTDIRKENHPRYHAKFAKKGLATKLVFSSEFRFHGLRLPTASCSLWFYSIQGLFRVAFELYSKQEQLFVLEAFQALWKSRINDAPLNACYDLSAQLNAPLPDEIVAMHDRETLHKLRSQNISRARLELPQVAEVPDEGHEEGTSPPDGKSTADHDYCSPADGEPADRPGHLRLVFEKLTSLEKALKASEQLFGKEQQEAMLLLLGHTEKLAAQGPDEEALAETVLGLLRTQGPGPGAGDSVYSSPLLRAVGGWLGRQFHSANTCISQQVEGFKVRHIERITDLPPAEELAGELFPEAMRILLLTWMGLDEASALWKRHSEYPIVLLILEFANHNLITGVAHVLYSSLICK
ncbi:hypothetical protein COCON_G00165830 [Conger conger]|uniref:Uncharacterized protein n=1 Tax=Conger conger TaxID=82655 RepID=A0A9Q1D700_CONCO|nr:uncharacterized protein si:ch211-110p13.9 [Conger conger]KAJ8260860.1 hypothetical protein COCON_G00165830 [Conger conger]